MGKPVSIGIYKKSTRDGKIDGMIGGPEGNQRVLLAIFTNGLMDIEHRLNKTLSN